MQSTIEDSNDNSLGPAATVSTTISLPASSLLTSIHAQWADSVRSEKAFAFTAPFHFIDAEGETLNSKLPSNNFLTRGADDPTGGSCSVEQTRDCGSTGCICASFFSHISHRWPDDVRAPCAIKFPVSAIANYTLRVTDSSLAAEQHLEALKFIDHVRAQCEISDDSNVDISVVHCHPQFMGDIGQPLHVEAFETGGNDIDAICGGKSTNLHAVSRTVPVLLCRPRF